MVKQIKVPKMHLRVDVAGTTKEFVSPLAETILAQVRSVVVGEEQIQFFDTTDNKFKSFTYCCGDKYEFNYTVETVTLAETEYDCYGFPITYSGDVDRQTPPGVVGEALLN